MTKKIKTTQLCVTLSFVSSEALLIKQKKTNEDQEII